MTGFWIYSKGHSKQDSLIGLVLGAEKKIRIEVDSNVSG